MYVLVFAYSVRNSVFIRISRSSSGSIQMTLDDLIWEFFNETKTEGIRFTSFSREYGYRCYRTSLTGIDSIDVKQVHARIDNVDYPASIYGIVVNRTSFICTCDTSEAAYKLKDWLIERIPLYQLIYI